MPPFGFFPGLMSRTLPCALFFGDGFDLASIFFSSGIMSQASRATESRNQSLALVFSECARWALPARELGIQGGWIPSFANNRILSERNGRSQTEAMVSV